MTNMIIKSIILLGNGYIEGKELENFFRELEAGLRGTNTVSVDRIALHRNGR